MSYFRECISLRDYRSLSHVLSQQTPSASCTQLTTRSNICLDYTILHFPSASTHKQWAVAHPDNRTSTTQPLSCSPRCPCSVPRHSETWKSQLQIPFVLSYIFVGRSIVFYNTNSSWSFTTIHLRSIITPSSSQCSISLKTNWGMLATYSTTKSLRQCSRTITALRRINNRSFARKHNLSTRLDAINSHHRLHPTLSPSELPDDNSLCTTYAIGWKLSAIQQLSLATQNQQRTLNGNLPAQQEPPREQARASAQLPSPDPSGNRSSSATASRCSTPCATQYWTIYFGRWRERHATT